MFKLSIIDMIPQQICSVALCGNVDVLDFLSAGFYVWCYSHFGRLNNRCARRKGAVRADTPVLVGYFQQSLRFDSLFLGLFCVVFVAWRIFQMKDSLHGL